MRTTTTCGEETMLFEEVVDLVDLFTALWMELQRLLVNSIVQLLDLVISHVSHIYVRTLYFAFSTADI